MGGFLRFSGFMVAIAGFALGVSYLLSVAGCGGNNKEPTKPSQPSVPAMPAEPDFSDLLGVLAGEWKKETTGDGYGYTLQCTDQTMTWKFEEAREGMRSRLDPLMRGSIVCSYKLNGQRIEVIDTKGESQSFAVEFISGREIVFAPAQDQKKPNGNFIPADAGNMSRSISGRWLRTARPANRTNTDPIAQAKQQVSRIEQKLQKVEAVQRDAKKDMDEMVAKLREMGIGSAADLKKNPRGQRMAENLAKLTAEIEAMDSQLATIDTELLKARSIVRRMEREQAGISDDEMRDLSRQLREAEARTDSAPRIITPVDVDAALEAALKGAKKR